MECIDLVKLHPDEYRAVKGVRELRTGKAVYLALDGVGEPGGEAFQQAIQALYGMAYTARFALKKRGELDFKVMPLECAWGAFDPAATPRAQWRWSLMVRIPEAFSPAHMREFGKLLEEQKGLDAGTVRRIRFPAGRCLQALHLGPYEELHRTYALLEEHAARSGATPLRNACREIYLSDPRRTAPERLKTLVRIGIE